MLAGHGDTGHVFDDFAPRLTDNFRVFALTRRGFGASSQPDHGYDLTTLVTDIARVVDALGAKRIHLVGHSIAGDEMTRFALTFPERTGKLAYIEAAYDRVEAQHLQAQFPKLKSLPEPASGSPQAIRAFVARTEILMPESEIRATRVFGADNRFLHPVTPDKITSAVAAMVEHPNYEAIPAPLLAIYAVYKDPTQLAPRYKTADIETRHALDQVFNMWQQFAKQQRDEFRSRLPLAQVVELNGASHYVFLSNREQVLRELRLFLRSS